MTPGARPADPPPARRWHDAEDGAVVLWLLGLCVLLLSLGGLSVDLWHVFSERRALVGAADAAAFAGASGLDVDAFRASGDVVLSPPLAEDLARAALARQDDLGSLDGPPEVVADPAAITVTLEGRVELRLLRLLAPGVDSLELAVTATAEPRAGG